MLFLGWRLVFVLEVIQLLFIFVIYIGSGIGVVENLEENIFVIVKEQGDEQEWSLILVNRQNFIFVQYDVEFEQLLNGEWIDIWIFFYFQDLFDVVRVDGVYLIVVFGYWIIEKQ